MHKEFWAASGLQMRIQKMHGTTIANCGLDEIPRAGLGCWS